MLTSQPAAACGHGRRSGDRPSDRLRRRQDAHDARHLPSGERPPSWQRLEGVAIIPRSAGSTGWQAPKVAVFVGSSKGTDVSLILKKGPKVHTLWGYIAWRLAGEAGLKLIAEAEAARTNPGSELMVEVFKLAGPSVILLDELVASRGNCRTTASRRSCRSFSR